MSSTTLSTLYIMNITQTKTRLFHCRGESYRVNRGTWAFWPRARLIVYSGPTPALRLVTSDAAFIALAVENDCAVSDELPEQIARAECTAALVKKGFTVWSIAEALAHAQTSPESDTTQAMIETLVQWFFLEKLPPPLPSYRSES